MSEPAIYGITIHCGATFKLEVAWTDSFGVPVAITPTYEARMQIRPKATSDEILASISSASGEITLDAPTTGIIKIRVPATVTELITQKGVYDLELFSPTDAGEVERLMQGTVTVVREVTQP